VQDNQKISESNLNDNGNQNQNGNGDQNGESNLNDNGNQNGNQNGNERNSLLNLRDLSISSLTNPNKQLRKQSQVSNNVTQYQ